MVLIILYIYMYLLLKFLYHSVIVIIFNWFSSEKIDFYFVPIFNLVSLNEIEFINMLLLIYSTFIFTTDFLVRKPVYIFEFCGLCSLLNSANYG